MKKYQSLYYYSLIICLLFGMSSCLKDDKHLTDFSSVGQVAEIPSSAFYGVVANKSFELSNTPVPYSFDVNIASPNTPTQSTVVDLMIDTTILSKYNLANGTNLILLPSSSYTYQTSVTVPAGSRIASETINFKTNTIDPTASFALPIAIKSASNGTAVSSNYGYKLIVIKIKNSYEGAYHSIGTLNHPTAGIRKIDRDKTLQTIDAATCETELGDLGGSGYKMFLTVNSDNTVTIKPSGVTPNIDQHWGANVYDPVKKSFTLNYSYNVAAPRIISEVITLK